MQCNLSLWLQRLSKIPFQSKPCKARLAFFKYCASSSRTYYSFARVFLVVALRFVDIQLRVKYPFKASRAKHVLLFLGIVPILRANTSVLRDSFSCYYTITLWLQRLSKIPFQSKPCRARLAFFKYCAYSSRKYYSFARVFFSCSTPFR